MAVIFPIKSTFDPTGVNSAKKAFNGLSTTSRNLAKNVLLPTVALGAVAFKFVKAGENAATANARILQINKSMGLFGSQTQEVTDRLVKLAEKTALNTGVDQNAIKLTQAKLLTFKELAQTANVVGGSFDRATAAAVDMAASGFGDAASNAVQLGKALNDPIKGITALTRSGITFTAEEKKLIATLVQSGQTLQAQEMILKAIEKQVGGTAEATANSSDKIKVAFSQVSEQIGTALLPAFDRIAKFTIDKIIPALQVFINALVGKTSVGSSLTESQETAYKWGNIIRAVIETVVNYQRFIVGFGAALAAMFVIAKVSAAASVIVTIIGGIVKALQTLRTVGIAATIATAFATGGVSVVAGAAGAVAAAAAIAVAFAGINSVMNNYKENVEALPIINVAPDGVLQDAKTYKDVVLPTVDQVGKSGTKAAKGVKAIGDAGKYAKAQIAAFQEQLDKANGVLDKAREAYASFKSSVADTLSGILDFGAAATAETGSFVENLVAQAAKAANFGSKVQQLLGMGLSESALAKVLEAGADAGTKIADEIIAGGATVVNQVNSLITATQSVAESVGESAATQFYSAGVTAGQALVDGVKAAIAAAGFAVNTEGLVVNQRGIDQVNAAVAKARTKKSKGGKKITKGEKKSISDLANALGVDIPAMAAGGIVTRPTLALIGEAGPEAVVPLNRNNTPTGNTYNLTVNAGMGADGNQIGREIVDAIKRYERTSGPVFKSA
jgi:hypothetical protein